MVVEEKELYLRFTFYDDDELLHIVTVGRAEYRPEALAAAEQVLLRRGIEPPPALYAPGPLLKSPSRPAGDGGDEDDERPQSPYQFIDLCVDALLIGFVVWAMEKLEDWTIEPLGELWGTLVYFALFLALIRSLAALRQRWRALKWKD